MIKFLQIALILSILFIVKLNVTNSKSQKDLKLYQDSIRMYRDSCLILHDTINMYRTPKSIVKLTHEKEIAKNGDLNTDRPKTKIKKSATKKTTNKIYKSNVCGARTKKGGYCSRTVNGGGRCWQH